MQPKLNGEDKLDIAQQLCSLGTQWQHLGLLFETKHKFELSYQAVKSAATPATPDLELCEKLINAIFQRNVTLEELVEALENKRINLNTYAADLRRKYGLKLAPDASSLPSKTFYFEVNNEPEHVIMDKQALEELRGLLDDKRQVIISHEISIGGTTLANEFCATAPGYVYVVWLDSTDESTLLASFLRLADWFKIPTVESQSLKDFISSGQLRQLQKRLSKGKTLMVFAKCWSIEEIRQFIPSRADCHIIVTMDLKPTEQEEIGFGICNPTVKFEAFSEKCKLFVRMVALARVPIIPVAFLIHPDVAICDQDKTVEQLKIELQQFIYKKFISFDGDELKVDTEFVTAMQRFVSDPKSRHIITKLWISVLASTNRNHNSWKHNNAKFKIFRSLWSDVMKDRDVAASHLEALIECLGFSLGVYPPIDFMVERYHDGLMHYKLIDALLCMGADYNINMLLGLQAKIDAVIIDCEYNEELYNQTFILIAKWCEAFYTKDIKKSRAMFEECRTSLRALGFKPDHPFYLKVEQGYARTFFEDDSAHAQQLLASCHDILEEQYRTRKNLSAIAENITEIAHAMLLQKDLACAAELFQESLTSQLQCDEASFPSGLKLIGTTMAGLLATLPGDAASTTRVLFTNMSLTESIVKTIIKKCKNERAKFGRNYLCIELANRNYSLESILNGSISYFIITYSTLGIVCFKQKQNCAVIFTTERFF